LKVSLKNNPKSPFHRTISSARCILHVLSCIRMYPVLSHVDSRGEVNVSLKSNVGLILLLTGTSLGLTSCSRVSAKTNGDKGEDVPVRATRAILQDVPREIAEVGTVEPIDTVDVKPRIAGQVERVAFQEGQTVAKGQLLFTIDRDALERQAAEQRADVSRDAAMEEQARALVVRESASQRESESEAQTAVQLGKLGVLSGQRVDQLVTARDTANAGLHSDRAAVEAAVAARKADEARLAETELQLSFANVVAPIAGRAGAAMVKAGNIVADDGATLVTLMQTAPIEVIFGIPEQALPEVQQLNAQGPLPVEASYGSGSAREGHLVFIDNTVDATTGTIRLKAIFPNADGALWPGEFVHVHLRLRIELSRTVIPNASVQDGINGKYVWLVREERASMTPVTVVHTYVPENGSELAVLGNGIRPGDLVVTEGQLRLTQDARVLLLNAP
jgi:multidrug efflux system membrane fusion protein